VFARACTSGGSCAPFVAWTFAAAGIWLVAVLDVRRSVARQFSDT
jgi:hypothetical protein